MFGSRLEFLEGQAMFNLMLTSYMNFIMIGHFLERHWSDWTDSRVRLNRYLVD